MIESLSWSFLTFCFMSLLSSGHGFIVSSVRYKFRQPISTQVYCNTRSESDTSDPFSSKEQPLSIKDDHEKFLKTSAVTLAAAAALVTNPREIQAALGGENLKSGSDAADKSIDSTTSSMPLGKEGYTTLGDNMRMCRLLNGMWQVSGYHGYEPQKENVIADMSKCVDRGFTTFDLADIYGPAESFVGAFRKGRLASSQAQECQFFTKWVPSPQEINRKIATAAIDRSLYRMNADYLDLVQFHWWDYKNKYYYDAVAELMHLKDQEKILNIGLTNFDTEHMVDLMDESAPIVSNQVSFSVIDTRPLKLLVPASLERGVKLLVYGSLMGGFLSQEWLNKPAPSPDTLTNVSLRKYLPWIYYWGGWDLFQEMLRVLNEIGRKYQVSLSAVAVRWVLEQQAVGGAIVGVRFGLRGHDHLEDNKKIFRFSLDEEDKAAIAAVQSKGKDLMNVFGDCGGEYRRRG